MAKTKKCYGCEMRNSYKFSHIDDKGIKIYKCDNCGTTKVPEEQM